MWSSSHGLVEHGAILLLNTGAHLNKVSVLIVVCALVWCTRATVVHVWRDLRKTVI
jgi:hypothetical protein